MARCGCSGGSCSCLVTGSGAVTVTGTGSVNSPYIVSADLNLQVTDTSTIDLAITGDGSVASPWTISAGALISLDELTDVDTTSATTGQVLAKQADGQWRGVAATTAPTGAITLSSTGGLQGDGSGGNPLSIKLPGSSGLILDATGLRMSGGGAWTTFTPTLTGTTTNPAIGNGSLTGAYSQQGKNVSVNIDVVIGSTTTRGVGAWLFALPVTPLASRWHSLSVSIVASGVADYVGTARIQGSTRVERTFIATSTAAQALSHSVPASLPAGSHINITGTYEAA